MRSLILASALVLLAACGQRAPALPEPPAAEEQMPASALQPPGPAGTPLTTGEMGAMSNTAMSITGSLTVAANALSFEKGFAAQTEYLGPVDATSLIAAGGQSFAAAAPGPASLHVELRRIVGAAPAELCGAATPATYVALASDEPTTGLTLIVFSGLEEPGPNAHQSAVCATYSYAVD